MKIKTAIEIGLCCKSLHNNGLFFSNDEVHLKDVIEACELMAIYLNKENEPINPADGLEKCPNCITGHYDNHIDICGVCGHERRRGLLRR